MENVIKIWSKIILECLRILHDFHAVLRYFCSLIRGGRKSTTIAARRLVEAQISHTIPRLDHRSSNDQANNPSFFTVRELNPTRHLQFENTQIERAYPVLMRAKLFASSLHSVNETIKQRVSRDRPDMRHCMYIPRKGVERNWNGKKMNLSIEVERKRWKSVLMYTACLSGSDHTSEKWWENI